MLTRFFKVMKAINQDLSLGALNMKGDGFILRTLKKLAYYRVENQR